MALFIRDAEVGALAEEVRKLTKARTKTEAVRRALQVQLAELRRAQPIRERLARAEALADAMGPGDPAFEMKRFTDDIWEDDRCSSTHRSSLRFWAASRDRRKSRSVSRRRADTSFRRRTPGRANAEPILAIVPDQATLVVEAMVANGDVGVVDVGQKAAVTVNVISHSDPVFADPVFVDPVFVDPVFVDPVFVSGLEEAVDDRLSFRRFAGCRWMRVSPTTRRSGGSGRLSRHWARPRSCSWRSTGSLTPVG
jgi:antitoxin VapB